MKAGILGYGIVGRATERSLKLKNPVIHDIKLDTKLSDLSLCDVVFVCVPTSSDNDIDVLINTLLGLKNLNRSIQIVIRSTLPIGTGEHIENVINDKIIYMPEFLRERCWQLDVLLRPLVVGTNLVKVPDWLKDEDYTVCSIKEAEILKMLSNTMASSRVVLANHFYDISKKVNADYDKIVSAYIKVNHDQHYLDVNENLRGFGGKCLPKDLEFLITSMKHLNIDQSYFTAIRNDNNKWPITVKKY